MSGPYGTSAQAYWDAGWRGVLPLPAGRKGPPPEDYTGWAGRDPSFPDVVAWTEDRADGNVALHLPPGVIGLDVDNYGSKAGKSSLDSAERMWGPLPDTWITTSRQDGVSGIRLYSVPVGLRWPGGFGPGTETIHSGHRYAVAPPSVHPDTGRAYRWINPDGVVSTAPPELGSLPELPMTWVVGMTNGREAKVLVGAGMGDDEIKDWCRSADTGTAPCDRMAEAVEDMLTAMPGAAHESLAGLMRVVGLAGAGHPGLLTALRSVRHAFLTEVTRPGREHHRTESEATAEWSRSLFGAVDKVVGERLAEGLPNLAVGGDPCDQGELTVLERPNPSPVTEEKAPPVPEDDGELEDQPTPPEGMTAEQRWEVAVAAELAQQRLRAEARQRLEAERAPAFRALSFTEFISGPKPEPVVPGLLYRDSLSRVFGAPGSGKSFVALDLAFHVALGRPWGGEAKAVDVEACRVAYVMAEGQRVNNLRARAWQERHGVADAELEGRFYSVPDALALTESAVGPFVAWVRETNVGLVILDTKNAMMVGEENSATDSAIMRRALDAIRKATDACVVLVDHTGKTDHESARGSSAVKAAMDTEIRVDNDGERPAGVAVIVTRDKAAEAGSRWDFRLRFHPLDDGDHSAVLIAQDEDDGTRTPEVRERPGWIDASVVLPEQVQDYRGDGKGAMEVTARFLAVDAGGSGAIGVTLAETMTNVNRATGWNPRTVRRCWVELRKMGYLAPADDKWDTNVSGRHVWMSNP